MANVAYDFLTDSFLFRDPNIETFFSNFSEAELESELRRYREHICKNINLIISEIKDGKELINISIESFGCLPDEDLLKQLALYIDKVIIPDPVFEHTTSKDKTHESLSKFMGVKSQDSIDRQNLARNIRYMKRTTPLVVNGFVKYFPLTLIHEPPKELPIYYSENNFSEDLPPDIYQYFYNKSSVHNIEIVDGFMTYSSDKPLELGTIIHVGFDDERIHKGAVYQFMQSKLDSVDSKSGKLTLEQYIPDAIDEKVFKAWVLQSINRAAIKTYKDVFNELVLSKRLNSMYLTKSPFSAGLLDKSIEKKSIQSDLANLSMQLELPIFNQLSLNEIINIRCNYGVAFHNFRTELSSKLLDLRTITNPNELSSKLQNVSFELSNVQVAEVNKEFRKLLRSFGADFTLLTGSLVTSFCTGGLTLVGAAGAVAKGVIDYSKYLSEFKENNGYFLWKLNKR